jgi:putative phage-type endonuclease
MNESSQSIVKIETYRAIPSEGVHKKFQFTQTRKRPLPNDIEIEIHDEEKTKEIKNEKKVLEQKKECDTIQDFYKVYIERTEEECEMELQHVQKSEGWLKSRHYCITASQFGSALGLNPYQTPDQFIHEKLYNKFEGNASTEWGNLHENDARKLFCEWLRNKLIHEGYENIEFSEPNLIKYSQCPWIGVSPDGVVKYEKDGKLFWDLIEYKCPSKYKDTNPYEKYLLGIPPQYMAQIQGIMGYCNTYGKKYEFNQAWFVVWTPENTFIKKVFYSEEYYTQIYKGLEEWYFKKYLPSIFYQFKKIEPTNIILA